MKKQLAIATASILILGLSTSFAQAGAARRHTIEGFLLGTGVTLLGTAIVNSINSPPPMVASTLPPRCPGPRYAPHHKRHGKGHWEIRNIWIEPIYESKWNPGHYNKRGKWVSGRVQEFIVTQGYWEKEKVWVRNGRRF